MYDVVLFLNDSKHPFFIQKLCMFYMSNILMFVQNHSTEQKLSDMVLLYLASGL